MLEINQLSFDFPNRKNLLCDLNLEVRVGEMFGLIGPNGSGKSTLIRLLLGAHIPTQGKIRFFGESPNLKSSIWKSRLGLVAGAQSKLFATLNVHEHIKLYSGLYPSFSEKWVLEQLEAFKLSFVLNKFSSQISFGERILTETLLTLGYKPSLLLFDEPTVGVDVLRRQQVHQVLGAYLKSVEALGILTSHNFRDITDACTRGAFLREGQFYGHFETGVTSWESLESDFIRIYQ